MQLTIYVGDYILSAYWKKKKKNRLSEIKVGSGSVHLRKKNPSVDSKQGTKNMQ